MQYNNFEKIKKYDKLQTLLLRKTKNSLPYYENQINPNIKRLLDIQLKSQSTNKSKNKNFSIINGQQLLPKLHSFSYKSEIEDSNRKNKKNIIITVDSEQELVQQISKKTEINKIKGARKSKNYIDYRQQYKKKCLKKNHLIEQLNKFFLDSAKLQNYNRTLILRRSIICDDEKIPNFSPKAEKIRILNQQNQKQTLNRFKKQMPQRQNSPKTLYLSPRLIKFDNQIQKIERPDNQMIHKFNILSKLLEKQNNKNLKKQQSKQLNKLDHNEDNKSIQIKKDNVQNKLDNIVYESIYKVKENELNFDDLLEHKPLKPNQKQVTKKGYKKSQRSNPQINTTIGMKQNKKLNQNLTYKQQFTPWNVYDQIL